VIAVRYSEKLGADACVKLMNGRFFAGRQIKASIFDGKTKHNVGGKAETTQDEMARLERYARWLEQGGEGPMPEMPSTDSQGGDASQYVATDDDSTSDSSDDEEQSDEDTGVLYSVAGTKVTKKLIGDKDREYEVEESYFEDDDDEEKGPIKR
jgi:hypothetical protein